MRRPYESAIERTCSSSLRPSAPISRKPELTITAPATPASPHSRIVSGTFLAGTATTARSILRGTWLMAAYAWMPCTEGAVMFTGYTTPSYSAPMRLRRRM